MQAFLHAPVLQCMLDTSWYVNLLVMTGLYNLLRFKFYFLIIKFMRGSWFIIIFLSLFLVELGKATPFWNILWKSIKRFGEFFRRKRLFSTIPLFGIFHTSQVSRKLFYCLNSANKALWLNICTLTGSWYHTLIFAA